MNAAARRVVVLIGTLVLHGSTASATFAFARPSLRRKLLMGPKAAADNTITSPEFTFLSDVQEDVSVHVEEEGFLHSDQHVEGGAQSLSAQPADFYFVDTTWDSMVSAYNTLCNRHYLRTATAQGGLIRVAANMIAQTVLVARGMQQQIILSTLLTMLCLGATMSGVCGHVDEPSLLALPRVSHPLLLRCTRSHLPAQLVQASWTRWLDQKVGHRHRGRDAVAKAAIDFFLWAPLCNSTYLLICPLVRGETLAAAWGLLRERFLAVMALEAMCFMPYNLLAFSVIPLCLRPLGQSCVAAIFAIGLSVLC